MKQGQDRGNGKYDTGKKKKLMEVIKRKGMEVEEMGKEGKIK